MWMSSGLAFGQMIRVVDPAARRKAEVHPDSNQMVAHVIAIKEVVEVTPDAVAADAAAGAAEPEVVKKGKQDAEEGAEPACCRQGQGRRQEEGKEISQK